MFSEVIVILECFGDVGDPHAAGWSIDASTLRRFSAALELDLTYCHLPYSIAQVLLAHQCRSQRVDDAFFPRLAAAFKVEPVSQRPGEPERGAIDLYLCERLE